MVEMYRKRSEVVMAERKVRKNSRENGSKYNKENSNKNNSKNSSEKNNENKGCSKGRFPYRRTGSVSVQCGNAL